MLTAEAVAQLQDTSRAVAEVPERLVQRLVGEDLRRALVRRLGVLVGENFSCSRVDG
jgi:hypothetical protein